MMTELEARWLWGMNEPTIQTSSPKPATTANVMRTHFSIRLSLAYGTPCHDAGRYEDNGEGAAEAAGTGTW